MAAFVHHATASSPSCGEGDPKKASEAMRDMFGPQAVDQQVRAAISTCWMLLPEGKKNPEAVAAEIRRVVERALENLKEDAASFGFSTGPEPAGSD